MRPGSCVVRISWNQSSKIRPTQASHLNPVARSILVSSAYCTAHGHGSKLFQLIPQVIKTQPCQGLSPLYTPPKGVYDAIHWSRLPLLLNFPIGSDRFYNLEIVTINLFTVPRFLSSRTPWTQAISRRNLYQFRLTQTYICSSRHIYLSWHIYLSTHVSSSRYICSFRYIYSSQHVFICI